MSETPAAHPQQAETFPESTTPLEGRVRLLEEQALENAAKISALMLVLRATVQSSGLQPQIAQMCENMQTMIQAQPGIVLGDKKLFEMMKKQTAWVLAPPPPQP